MGRVYEALKRAAENGNANTKTTDDAAAATSRRAAANTAAATVVDDEVTLVAEAQPANGNSHANSHGNSNGGGGNGHAAPEVFSRRSSAGIFNAPDAQAHVSASVEHIDAATAGSALPGGQASRVAGATADAVGSTRALEFPSVEISHARVEPHLIAITDPRSPHAEQYRALRTRVLHAGERRHIQAIVVSSAGVMEGKTITALNLAWLLAQTDGVRALLIDGDLRRPCAAEYLGIEAPAGLSEVLAGEATLQEAIIKLDPAGLHLLPGGTVRDNVAEILSGPKFSSLLAQLRRLFDYIIIDAPPLGIFTDATVLIGRADAALMVVRAGKTRYAALDRVLEPLPRERLLGIVLNGADDNKDDSSSYYQRRYYRREETEKTVNRES
ncbi:MAG TPA: CpsD/CapB family tyrosine-protein kinase [Pyrinomonadaceae bacterium]|jgi:capsular exopolysaccharide synthesis family protein|nr:CpsD/CapB family tyrosine-protein kinase [Pyrinomonadaceae bacterium]